MPMSTFMGLHVTLDESLGPDEVSIRYDQVNMITGETVELDPAARAKLNKLMADAMDELLMAALTAGNGAQPLTTMDLRATPAPRFDARGILLHRTSVYSDVTT